METSVPLNPSDLFSARDLVVVLTGGGSDIIIYIAEIFNQGSHD